jgi:hypothetical protein
LLLTLEQLVAEFGNCVAAQSDAVAQGDAETGNRFAKRYIAAFAEIRRRGDVGRNALAALLDDGWPPFASCLRAIYFAIVAIEQGPSWKRRLLEWDSCPLVQNKL